jgi:hypothetical protein
MNAPPVFIVGCGRSGTSLLRNLLRAHPRMTFPDESHFIPTFYRAYGDPTSSREACKLARIILKLWWVRKWGLSVTPESFADCRSFREVVSRLFEAYAQKANKERWGDKTPSYVLNIPTLLELFSDCQIIHIYRDGRDVALSQFKHPSAQSRNALIAATNWKHRVSVGREIGSTLPAHQYTEVRYESLISEPESTLRAVCDFLDEPFSPAMLRPNYLDRKAVGRVFGPSHKLDVATEDIVESNQQKWKRQMSVRDRALFESIAGTLLEELGYETEGHGHTPSTLERSFWRVHQGFWFLLARLNASNKRDWIPTHARMRWAIIRCRLRSLGVIS